jgi:glutamate synthase domain-containing protein 3
VAVLGTVGRNACAGMTGGTAYFLADATPAWLDGHATVADAGMDAAAVGELSALLRSHLALTGSAAAAGLLARPEDLAGRFVRVRPADVRSRHAGPLAPAHVSRST